MQVLGERCAVHAVLLTATKEGCSQLASAADFLSVLNSPHLKENRKEEEGCKSQVFTLCDLLPTLQHNECSLLRAHLAAAHFRVDSPVSEGSVMARRGSI